MRSGQVIRFEGPEGQPRLSAENVARCVQLGIPPEPGIGVAWSGDGDNWRHQYPVLRATAKLHHHGTDDWGGGDGYNHIIWAPTLKKYVMCVRTNIDRQPHGGRKERSVGRLESEDFIHWTPHQVCLRPWTDWHHRLGYLSHDFYQLPVFFHEGIYWSIGSVFWWQSDTVHLELFWIPDTVHWERVCPYQDFIPHGLASAGSTDASGRPPWEIFADNPRAVDSGCNFAIHEPVFLGDEVRVYYGASPGRHNAEPGRRSALCLATFRRDRLAGVANAGNEIGRITTHPLELTARAPVLNAHASNGRIRVGIRDEQGNVLTGFSLSDCVPFCDDSLATAVRWKRGGNPGAFAGRTVRLEIELESATLYSVSLGG